MSDWQSELDIIDVEIEKIVAAIVKDGEKQDDGSYEIPYGKLLKIKGVPYDAFSRLKSGKKKGVFDYKGQFLMTPTHDKVIIKCLKPEWKKGDK